MNRSGQSRAARLASLLLALVLILTSVADAAPSAGSQGPSSAAPGIWGGVHAKRQLSNSLNRFSVAGVKASPPAGQAPAEVLGPAISTINVNYLAAGHDFYGVPCEAWPPSAMTAFDYAANVWETLVQSSVPIKVDACWVSGATAGAWAYDYEVNFDHSPLGYTWYPYALADALRGSDGAPGSPDIEGVFGNGVNWYFGTTGSPAPGQYDFVTAAMAEIGRGLGFEGSLTVDAGLGSWGFGASGSVPTVYDRLVVNGSGQSLVDTFANNSTALAAQLQSNNVYFDGPQAKAANGGNRPKLFAPTSWPQYFNLSYLDETYNGTPNALMTAILAPQEVIHDPGPIGLAVLRDLGWVRAPTVTGFTPTSGPPGTSVTINGTNFTEATSVAFNGTPATVLTVDSNTQITAVVPADATSGLISVSTFGWTAFSANAFLVSEGGLIPQIVLLTQPVRVVDTRTGQPKHYLGEGKPLLGTSDSHCFTLTGQAGVPQNATAVLVNLTAVGYSRDGWIAAYPYNPSYPAGSQPEPKTSSLNFDTQENAIANFAIVALGSGGQLCLTASSYTNAIVDVSGYMVSTPEDQVKLLAAPQRVVDTRPNLPQYQGSGSPLSGYTGHSRFKITEHAGVPTNATAVLVNLTAVGYKADGWLSAYPACTTLPDTSNVNFDTVENAIAGYAIVRLGSTSPTDTSCLGSIDVTGAPGTNVIVDVTGYLVQVDSPQIVLLDSPKRIVDTRPNLPYQGSGSPLDGNPEPKMPRSFYMTESGWPGGVPNTARGVIANLTTVGYTRDGWVAAGPPVTSSVNFDLDENAIANTAILRLGTDGEVSLVACAPTNVIIDVSAYLAR